MKQSFRRPKLPLGNFVDVLWLMEGFVPGCGKERLLPDGSMELVIDLGTARVRIHEGEDASRTLLLPGEIVIGAQSEYFAIDSGGHISVAGVHFHPGGAFAFFGMPACELRDMHVSLESLWGADGVAVLREQLLEAQTVDARFDVLEQALLSRASTLKRNPAVAFALRELSVTPQTRSLAEVSDAVGLSQRRFIQVFRQEVGLTPKLFHRIQRFQHVVRMLQTAEDVNWTDVALSCGYFDQAHFIHDFRAFSGFNPTSYLARRTQHMNHVPLGG